MGNSKKLTWLLLLQGWAMLWVVIGHGTLTETAPSMMFDNGMHTIAKALMTFAYSFHMPLFIMISGYLYHMTRISRSKPYGVTIKDKLIRLGIPYIAFIIFAFILKLAMPGGVNRQVTLSAWGVIQGFLYPFDGPLQEMWFIAVILIYFALYPIYNLFVKNRLTIAIGLLVGCVLYFVPLDSMTGFFAFNRAVHFLIFFLLGVSIHSLDADKWLSKPYTIITMVIVYVAAMIMHVILLTSICGSLAFWGLAIIIDKKLTGNLFSSFRNYTYQIFLVGIFAQMFVKVAYKMFPFTGSYLIYYAVCIIVGIYVPVLIAKFAERKNIRFLKYLLGV